MITEDKITVWLHYMVTQKSLIHFRPLINVKPQNVQHWRYLQFPILGVNFGTENHPKINIIPLEDFNDSHVEYWKNIMSNKSGLIKWNSNCNRIPSNLI